MSTHNTEKEINNCDGCQSGLPTMNDAWGKRAHWSKADFTGVLDSYCTKERYVPTEEAGRECEHEKLTIPERGKETFGYKRCVKCHENIYPCLDCGKFNETCSKSISGAHRREIVNVTASAPLSTWEDKEREAFYQACCLNGLYGNDVIDYFITRMRDRESALLQEITEMVKGMKMVWEKTVSEDDPTIMTLRAVLENLSALEKK